MTTPGAIRVPVSGHEGLAAPASGVLALRRHLSRAETLDTFRKWADDPMTKLVLSGESVVTSVLDYPSTIIQTSSGRLLSLYEKEDVNTLEERRTGVAVTRPLKIGNPAAYKIMDRIRNFGRIGKDSYVKYRIYGSMDGTAYAPLKSLRGKSYLFYRIAFYTNMLPKEGFSGTLIGFDYRMTNKFR